MRSGAWRIARAYGLDPVTSDADPAGREDDAARLDPMADGNEHGTGFTGPVAAGSQAPPSDG